MKCISLYEWHSMIACLRPASRILTHQRVMCQRAHVSHSTEHQQHSHTQHRTLANCVPAPSHTHSHICQCPVHTSATQHRTLANTGKWLAFENFILHITYTFHITYHIYISYHRLHIHFILRVAAHFRLHITCNLRITYACHITCLMSHVIYILHITHTTCRMSHVIYILHITHIKHHMSHVSCLM